MTTPSPLPQRTERLELAGTSDALGPATAFVERWSELAGLSPKGIYGLQLAVDELVTNIVTHAYAERGRTGPVVLEAELEPGCLRLIVEDTGDPYDPTAQPPPDDLDKPVEERKIGGLGIYLVLKSVDRVRYERRGSWNRVTLEMNTGGNHDG